MSDHFCAPTPAVPQNAVRTSWKLRSSQATVAAALMRTPKHLEQRPQLCRTNWMHMNASALWKAGQAE